MTGSKPTETPPLPLPAGIATRRVDTATGLSMRVLEAGRMGDPTLLLLHGFPELAYSWRRVIPALVDAGYHVIAPDQRGYGGTTGHDAGPDGEAYDVDISAYCMTALARDALALLSALGIPRVRAVIGHDFGSPVAATCALIRPDVFSAAACMSAPYPGPPAWPAPGDDDPAQAAVDALGGLTPPRKHYQWYYAERRANADMMGAPAGLSAFLRAYFHCKSGDWAGNEPHPLGGWTAEALAQLPRYYVMDRDATMAETAAAMAPSPAEAAACAWMTEDDLAVYAAEYGRTGFQGGLNWYRRMTSPEAAKTMRLFAGRRIEVPTCFIAGARDWGVRQAPGALEAMETTATADWRGATLIAGAGHWVQQEAPDETADALLRFLRGCPQAGPDARRRPLKLEGNFIRR